MAEQRPSNSTIRNEDVILSSDADITVIVVSLVRSTQGGQRRRFVTRFKVGFN